MYLYDSTYASYFGFGLENGISIFSYGTLHIILCQICLFREGMPLIGKLMLFLLVRGCNHFSLLSLFYELAINSIIISYLCCKSFRQPLHPAHMVTFTMPSTRGPTCSAKADLLALITRTNNNISTSTRPA